MSGGHFNYNFYNLYDVADELSHLIKTNGSNELNEYGDKVGRHYTEETLTHFKAAEILCHMTRVYLHRIDYLLSGDDGEKSFHSRLKEDLVSLERTMDALGKLK